jgi:hypothetical protein
LKYSNTGYTVLPPAILEQMSRSEAALEELKKLHVVAFGGGERIVPLVYLTLC